MTELRSQMRSTYMEFAKTTRARYPLGSSGVAPMTMDELGVTLADIGLSGSGGGYGMPSLLERIAAYCHVEPANVVTANGCSMAYHLAYAATFEPGDEVLIEEPAYEVMLTAARYLGAQVRRFQRPAAGDYQIDVAELARLVTPRTRLIVLCNLHNPSSALLGDDTLRAIGELARSVGARVLVDEVYLEAIYPRPQTAARLGPEFIVTSSLTKAYGLGGLRCGWILAEPDLARRIWRLNDLYGVHHPYVADRLSVLAFDRMQVVAQRAQNLLAQNRPLLHDFVRRRPELDCYLPPYGTTIFPRLKQGSTDVLTRLLVERHETMIVPGCYFERPQYFRLGLGIAADRLRESLHRLGAALDELKATPTGVGGG